MNKKYSNRTKVWCDKRFAEMLRVKASQNGFTTPSKYTEWLANEERPPSFLKDKEKKKRRKDDFYRPFF